MPDVRLRAMTVDEYDAWLPGAIEMYAADNVRAGSMPVDRAQELASQQFQELLPDGVDTPEHHLLVGTDEAEAQVGILWLHIRPPSSPTGRPSAFVYDIEVDEQQRRRGYGRGIMVAAECYARERDATSMRLHVFGANTVARRLYESLGYEATSIGMAKELDRT